MFSSLPYVFLSLFTLISGTLLSISSLHWFGVWFGLELNLIGFLPMLVFQKGAAVSESAVKYFIVQAVGSSTFICSCLVSQFYPEASMVSLFSLVLKMGGAPFHFWLPSVMNGLSWFPCLILVTWQKIAPIFLIFVLMSSALLESFLIMFCFISVSSSIIGGFGGINQTQVRSLLAYSSISHMGWMLFGLMNSFEVTKFYFIVYSFINLSIFLGLWTINSKNFKDFSMNFKDKFCGILILFKLVSLAGLPPLLGFIPKWSVMVSGMSSSAWSVIFLMVLGSLLGIFYYLSLFMYGVLSLGFVSLRGVVSPLIVLSVMLNMLGGVFLLMVYTFLS